MGRVIVIGGGASGMMAALQARRGGAEVLLLEQHDRLGRKLATTGNGRGNLSNEVLSVAQYHGENLRYAEEILNRFSWSEVEQVFLEMGLPCVLDERGRYYPKALQAKAVVELFALALEEANVEIRYGEEVVSLTHDGLVFKVKTGSSEWEGDAVIVATGGLAAPQLGANPGGYGLLQGFGHQLLPTAPAIVHLLVKETKICQRLNGLKWTCGLTYVGGKRRKKELGEVHFMKDGLSGPPVFQLSIPFSEDGLKGLEKGREMHLDFLPDWSQANLVDFLKEAQKAFPERALGKIFLGLFPKALGDVLLLESQLPLKKPLKAFPEKDFERLAQRVKDFVFQLVGTRPWSAAQVTLGGVDTLDFMPLEGQSYLCPGLFACGEILDVTGDCGGYNLQWAWSSGWAAGVAAADYVKAF